MEKKSKSPGRNRSPGGDKERGLHKHGHGHGHAVGACHGSFHGNPSFSGRVSHSQAEKGHKVSDTKSNKAVPTTSPKTHPQLVNREKPTSEQTPWPNVEPPRTFSRKIPPVESANGNNSSAKLLVNVTVAQSIGALRVLVSSEATVLDVIKAALAQYAKEGRRPILSSDPLSFGLHYSQFTIDCLAPEDKIKDAGSRNFFLCPSNSNRSHKASAVSCGAEITSLQSLTKPWYKLMDFFFRYPEILPGIICKCKFVHMGNLVISG